jgi:hypothetical protein
MGLLQHGWAIFLVVCGVVALIFKKFWPELKGMLALYLRERVIEGIDAVLWSVRPIRTVFFESEVKKTLGFFAFARMAVMEELENRKWAVRLEGRDSERGRRWQKI